MARIRAATAQRWGFEKRAQRCAAADRTDRQEKEAKRMLHTTKLDLFAGIPVADYAAALKWYERLLGSPPTRGGLSSQTCCVLSARLG